MAKKTHFYLTKPLQKTQNMSEKFNPLKPGESFLPEANLNLNYFWTTRWYEPGTLWLFVTFIKDYFAEKNLKQHWFSGGNIFSYHW